MRYRDGRAAWKALFEVGRTQGGYVTAQQAAAAGFGASHLSYHAAAGNLERVGHGLYRVRELPPSPHDRIVRIVLGTRGRDDRPRSVVSHATALSLHELSDVMPAKVHLLVPPGWRKPAPSGAILHRGQLTRAETEDWEGFAVTTPLRTLLDVAREGRLSHEQLDAAVADALQRGLVRRSVLERAVRRESSQAARERLLAALGTQA
jgi:predicted transcriptional regulator of viral defense system